MNIGEKLKAARKQKRLTLKEVASVTNLSISYISDIEHGKSLPPIDTLTSLCRALDISMYSFFKEEEPMFLRETTLQGELTELLRDFPDWSPEDKEELIRYLKAKKVVREGEA
ncbi:helix-turn-helix domain-containing protein [Proteiniclasticum ruminis]|uniref:helix-turn-helix domain-containing protein n=2 Tax=Proteiniclasticum ruminis TaxID=398199 RepID=UPI0028A7FC7B|nr:helix-turn-helix transcriptional regulator [Proteiniclasticum ruminis]